MCRLFAALSTENLHVPWFLSQAPRSLLKQSEADPKRLQSDGWGLGWIEQAPMLRKSAQPMYEEKALVGRVGKMARGKTLVGHVRWASNPMKLPKAEVMGTVNTQPFLHRGWIFAHNGTLLIPREVRAELGAWDVFVQGNNDSEVFFYGLLKHLDFLLTPGAKRFAAERIAKGLRESLADLDQIWLRCKSRYPIHRYPSHGLNFVLTNGEQLIAFCWVNAGGFDKSKALTVKKQPYYQLQYLITPTLLAVASEPLDAQKAWTPFNHGELLVASRKGDRFLHQRLPLS